MNIITGMFSTESNTFNPNLTKKEDFNSYFGKDMFEVIHTADIFENAGYNVVPTFASSALPGGSVAYDDYMYFKALLMHTIKRTEDLKGIWLHLHGAMEVYKLGSGELDLLKSIREEVGDDVVIGVVFDVHANHHMEIANYVDVVTGYRTVPHSDQKDCEIRVAEAMLYLLETQEKVMPSMSIVPMIVSGEKATDVQKPVRQLFDYVEQLSEDERILDASIFLGCPWADVPNGNFAVIVTPSKMEYKYFANEQCKYISEQFIKKKHEFEFIMDVLEPLEALMWANDQSGSPIFVTDSGDNTTGGAIGESTEMLRAALEFKSKTEKRILVSAIYDPKAAQYMSKAKIGQLIDINIGTERGEDEQKVNVTGVYYAKGNVMGFLNDADKVLGTTYLIRQGNLDIVISDKPTSLISPMHFKEAKVPINDYDICIVKQGYLFSELLPIAKASVMAATKGATYQYIEKLDFKNIQRPSYPFDEVVESDIIYNFEVSKEDI